MRIARADNHVDQSETAMIKRIADILGVTADDLRQAQQLAPQSAPRAV
jgi:uncharacterized tellurite resistance protein B-like protein